MPISVMESGRKKRLDSFTNLKKSECQFLLQVFRYPVLLRHQANYTYNYVWTQDGVGSHRAKKLQKFYKVNFADLWLVNFWHPSNLNLKLLNCSLCFIVVHQQNLSPQYIQGYQKEVEGQSIHGLRLVQPFECLLMQ